jgi:hypothetical protein
MQKAKSRIKTSKQPKTRSCQPRLYLKLSKKYLRHLPLLLLSLPFYAGAYYIFNYIHPAQVQNFLIPNTYLPLQLVFFLGNFFLFSYIFLKTRRGFELSLLLSFALFLKLQLITNYLSVAAGLLVIILILEILISLLKKN